MELIDCILRRRSGRNYNGQPVPEDALHSILEAGLLAPSSRNLKPVEFLVVRGRSELEALASVKYVGSTMLKSADCAIVILGDRERSDVWIEDCSIAATYMMLKATELGVANCWVQVRQRFTSQAQTESAESRARQLLGIPEQFGVPVILSLGMADTLPEPHTLADADFSKVHKQTY